MPVEAISTVRVSDNHTAEAKQNKAEVKTEPYPNDSLELSKKNEKKKTDIIKKSLLGVCFSLAASVGILVLVMKYHGNRIKKLYDEKLVIRTLKEKIDFQEAKTVEEGIKFAKEVLGIKDVDAEFTLEAINYANKGLVDVSNANKGKVFMPNALRFSSSAEDDTYLAAVKMDINSDEFANMYINKNYFDTQYLDKRLQKYLYKKDSNEQLFLFEKDYEPVYVSIWDKYIYADPSKEVAKLIDAYYKDSASLTIEQKRNLFYSLSYGKDKALRSFRLPMETLRRLEKLHGDFLQREKITIDYDSLDKKTHKEQKEFLLDLLEKMKQGNISLVKKVNLFSPLDTIYHEAGHLQDAAKNLKELDLKQWKFDWKGEWRRIRNKLKNNNSNGNTSRIGVDELDNRWGSIYKDYYSNLLDSNPDEFKKRFPDFYEFLKDKNIQQSAGKVSSYAQSGIGEFIADTYAQMILGKKIPEDVMTLYRRYKGPELLQ